MWNVVKKIGVELAKLIIKALAKVLNKEEMLSAPKEKPAEDDDKEDVDDGNVPFDRSPSGRNTS